MQRCWRLLLVCVLVAAGLTALPAAPVSAETSGAVAGGIVNAWGYNVYGQTAPPAGLGDVVAVAAGGYHTLALTTDGTVTAWGRNSEGQTDVPPGLSNVIAIAAGGFHSVALTADGSVTAWGLDDQGQGTVPPGLNNVIAIAAGDSFTIAVTADGNVTAWGRNNEGQTTVPAGLSNVATVAARANFSVALKTDGTVVAWGENRFGQTDVPPGLSNVVAIAAGLSHTVALKGDGTVTAWGNGDQGQTTVPTGLDDVVAVTAGFSHTVALTANGTVVAWGSDDGGQASVPFGLSNVTAIAAGAYHTVVVRTAGLVTTWGSNDEGQVSVPAGLDDIVAVSAGANFTVALHGDGTVSAWGSNEQGQTDVPPGLSDVTAIAAGGLHTLALHGDGTVSAWGWNHFGQTDVPPGLSNVVAIAAGANHSVALTADGIVTDWGANYSHQTDGNDSLRNIVAIAAGTNHTLVLRSDGEVAAWGNNSSGQTDVPTSLHNVVAITAGLNHSVALTADGTVVAWGDSAQGQTAVPTGLHDVVAIAAGSNHTLALKMDGTVTAWGRSDEGQTTVPVGLSDVVAIAAGTTHSVALHLFATPLNRAPTALTLSLSGVAENSAVGISVGTFTTIDPDAGDTHGYNLVAGEGDSDNAAFTISGDTLQTATVFDFESQSSYSIRVRTTDIGGLSLEATFIVTITNVNDTPIAADDGYTTATDTPLTVPAPGMLGNDTDPDGDPLSIVPGSGPFNGSMVSNPNGSFTYTPNSGFNGADTFTYQADDGSATSNIATVTITVVPASDILVATDDTYSADEDTPLSIAAPGVLDNDSIGESPLVTAVVVNSPQHGTLKLNPDGSFTYTPRANANGSDSFTYQATDGTVMSNIATVTLTVTPINDAPAAVGDAYETDENTALTVAAPGLLSNDTDIDGDGLSTDLVFGPSSGSLTIYADGSFIYTPDPGFSGSDSFTYRADDGIARSNVATVTITVLSVNETPTADAGGPYSVDEGGTVAVSATGSDAEDAALSFAWDLDGDGTFETSGQNVTFQATSLDGPATRTITVQVSDDDGGVATDNADVTIRNVAPTAAFNAPVTVDEGSTITFALTGPSDPSIGDTTVGFSYAFDCDDRTGYGAFSTSPSESCPTSDDGARTVKGKVRDKDGGETEYSASVTIANVAPSITLDGPAAVDEGGVYTLTLGAVSDPGDDIVIAYIIHWGDGSTETASTVGDVSHVYAEGPSNPTIAVDLTDEDGSYANAGTLAIAVNNVAPVVEPLTLTDPARQVPGTDTDFVVVGMEVDLASLFTDAGGQDTHTATIDWGDQSASINIDPATNPINASHTFDTVGNFTVSLTIVDDDGASATQSAVVNVADPLTATAAVIDDLAALVREKPDLALFAALIQLQGNNSRAANNGTLALLESDPAAALVKLGKALNALAYAPNSVTVANAEYVLTYVARAVAMEHQADAIAALGSNPSKGEEKQLDRIADDIATGDNFLANGAYPKAVSAYTDALRRALDLVAKRESHGRGWPPRSSPR